MDSINSQIYGGVADCKPEEHKCNALCEAALSVFLLGFALLMVIAYTLRIDFQFLLDRKVEEDAQDAS